MYIVFSFISRSSDQKSAFSLQFVANTVECGSTIVRTDMIPEAHINDTGFTDGFGIVVDIFNTVCDACIATTIVGYVIADENQICIRSDSIVFVSFICSGCNSRDVGSMAGCIILFCRDDFLGIRIFCSIIIAGGWRSRLVLIPYSFDTQIFTFCIVEIDMVILESTVDDADYNIFAGIGLGEPCPFVYFVYIAKLFGTNVVHSLMNRTSYFDVLYRW